VRIGKREAGSRQLDVAVELFFERRDVLAVFTVANAASVILSDLVSTRNPGTNWDQLGSEANGLPLNKWFEAIRRTPNFLKHARNDPDAFEEIEDSDVEHILFVACLNHGSMLKASETLPMPQSIFQLWYFVRYSKQLLGAGEDRLRHLVAHAVEIVGELPEDRSAAISVGARLLKQNM
jgi:hypothetical protein